MCGIGLNAHAPTPWTTLQGWERDAMPKTFSLVTQMLTITTYFIIQDRTACFFAAVVPAC
jgi:hypothetical protein